MTYQMEELIPIAGKLAERYTAFESTSVTYEKANQFMEAALYCIREGERASDSLPAAGSGIKAEQMYEAGFLCVKEKVKRALEIYNELTPQFSCYKNRCLHDTVIKGLPEFFRWYDAEFEPQNTIITLDYPVLRDLSGYTGINKIYEFIVCIRLEQIFLSGFPEAYVMRQMFRYDNLHTDFMENVCGIVLLPTVARMFLQKPFGDLDFEKDDYVRLRELFYQHGLDACRENCLKAVKAITENYGENSDQLFSYFAEEIENMAVRLKNASEYGTLENLI